MESLYKKKNLKFSGFSKDVKKKELLCERESSKYRRLSILRCMTEVIEETKENESKIPKFGQKKATGIPSRTEMLKKWKEEKLLKQQKEKEKKKPAFKVGVVPKVITPTLPLDKVLTQCSGPNSKGSFLQTSNVSKLSCNTDSKSKVSSKLPASSKATSDARLRKNKGPQMLKPVSSTLKTSQISKLESSSQKSLTAKSATSHLKSVMTTKPTSIKPIQKVPTSISSKTTVHMKKSEPQESTSSISKPVSSFLRSSRTSKETSVPLKVSQKPLSFKPSISKGAKSKETTTAAISNVQKTKISLEDISESITEELESQTFFNCNISHIEPVPSVRKSFAPENFLFCPPSELNFSCFNIDGPSAIFSRMKTERERTSTPLKETDQSSKLTTSSKVTSLKDTDQNLKSSAFKEADQDLKSTSLKEEDQDLKSTSLEEINQNLKSAPLKETSQSLNSSPLKEIDKSLQSVSLKETGESLKSISLKETNQDLMQNSVNEIDHLDDINDSFQKQEAFSKLEDIKELNTSAKLLKEPALISLDENNSKDINDKCISNSFQNGVLENETKQVEDDSVAFDKFLAEHGDEPLDTFSIVPGDLLKDIKVLDLNLPETRQSRKLSSGSRVKPKQSIKPNLESIRESSENKHCLGTTPKTSRKKATKDDSSFTPRRSVRLAEKFRRSGSFESLLNIERPSIMGSLDLDEPLTAGASSRITYDFDNLHLEDTPIMKRGHKVSLLYTPPTRGRPSTRKSIKGDLISFSPFQ